MPEAPQKPVCAFCNDTGTTASREVKRLPGGLFVLYSRAACPYCDLYDPRTCGPVFPPNTDTRGL